MPIHPSATIQVRIDSKTKKTAQHILSELGLDLSTAVKMLCKQIEKRGALPFELTDENGFSAAKATELRHAMRDSEKSKKTFRSSRVLLQDVLR